MSTLSVPKYQEISTSNLLPQLATLKNDTGKVRLLIKISGIYWRIKSVKNENLDSALLYARQAMVLSSTLRDTKGYLEASFLACKSLMDKSDSAAAKKVIQTVYGEQRVRLLIVMGEHYVFLPGEKKENLDAAYPFLNEALQLSTKICSEHWKTESEIIFGKYHFANGQIAEGKNMFLKVIEHYKAIGDVAGEAHWWSELGYYMPDTDETYDDKYANFQKSFKLFTQLKNADEAGHVLIQLGDLNKGHHKFALAEQEELQAVSLLTSIHLKNLWNAYLSLAETYEERGNTSRALYFGLLGLKNMESVHEQHFLGWPYMLLGDIYKDLDEQENSTKYYKLSLNILYSDVVTDYYGYITVKHLDDGLIILNKAKQALKFTENFVRQKPPVNLTDQEIIANAIADCYNGLGNFKMAERYFLEMIRLDNEAQLHLIKQMTTRSTITGPEAYYLISKFYIDHRKYKEATPYLQKAVFFATVIPTLQKNILFQQFRLDSAAGNYVKAIAGYERHTSIKDSIDKAERLKELAQLKIQFETDQKEKNIELLEKEGQLQKKELVQSFQLRLFTLAGMVVLAIFLGVLYSRFRLKQRNNLQLQAQQETINKKNQSLEQLVQEKEWLLKEVHHRVKNNLQTVISLLNSQSFYLKEGSALDALLESRHRVQAMSMIHQRLYQSANSSTIFMRSYIHELVSYLEDSFALGKRIIFHTDIEDISLDLAQAVPIGLILNEAITNALKYAFPGEREGEISITFSETSEKQITLCIADDGIGLPANLDLTKNKSFGLRLIQGLTSDVGGKLIFDREHGTTILVEFEKITFRGIEALSVV